MNIKITSPVSSENFEKYYRLRWEMLRKKMGQKRGTELDEFEEASFHVMAVNLSNNDVVGVGRIHALNENKFQIRYMAIKGSFQGLKIGTKILNKLENHIQSDKKNKIILHARENAVIFYKKNGYKIIKKSHKLMDKIQHYLMEKEI